MWIFSIAAWDIFSIKEKTTRHAAQQSERAGWVRIVQLRTVANDPQSGWFHEWEKNHRLFDTFEWLSRYRYWDRKLNGKVFKEFSLNFYRRPAIGSPPFNFFTLFFRIYMLCVSFTSAQDEKIKANVDEIDNLNDLESRASENISKKRATRESENLSKRQGMINV